MMSPVNKVDESLLDGAFTSNIHLIKESLEKGANVNYRNYYGQTALAIAAYHGHEDIIEYLVKRGAKINVTDRHLGATPLTLAVRSQKIEAVKYLLEKGADVNLVGAIGGEESESALSIATEKGNFDMVRLLVEMGADVNVVNEEGDTPLALAEQLGHTEIINFLRARGRK